MSVRPAAVLFAVLFALAPAAPTAAQTYSFVDPVLTVTEGATTVTFEVALSSASLGSVFLQYRTEESEALGDVDYTTTQGFLEWAPGSTARQSFTVTILDDAEVEGDESFWVYLYGADGATPGDLTFLTVTIVDDDGGSGPVARIDTLDALLDDQGRGLHVFPSGQVFGVDVVLDRVPTTPYTLNWTSDLPPFSGTIVFDGVDRRTILLGPVDVPPGSRFVRGRVEISEPVTARAIEGFPALIFTIVDRDSTEDEVCAACFVGSIFFPTRDFDFWCSRPAATSPVRWLARALPDFGRALSVLSDYRDQVLAPTAAGQDLIARYRSISGALARTIVQHPTFGYRVMRAQGPWIDAFEALTLGNGDQVTISAQMQSDLTALLDEFEQRATPADAARIAHERQRLQLDTVGGSTMTAFQQQMEDRGVVDEGKESWGGVKARFGRSRN